MVSGLIAGEQTIKRKTIKQTIGTKEPNHASRLQRETPLAGTSVKRGASLQARKQHEFLILRTFIARRHSFHLPSNWLCDLWISRTVVQAMLPCDLAFNRD